MKRTVIISMIGLVLLLAGAAFVGGRLFNQQQKAQAQNNQPLSLSDTEDSQ